MVFTTRMNTFAPIICHGRVQGATELGVAHVIHWVGAIYWSVNKAQHDQGGDMKDRCFS